MGLLGVLWVGVGEVGGRRMKEQDHNAEAKRPGSEQTRAWLGDSVICYGLYGLRASSDRQTAGLAGHPLAHTAARSALHCFSLGLAAAPSALRSCRPASGHGECGRAAQFPTQRPTQTGPRRPHWPHRPHARQPASTGQPAQPDTPEQSKPGTGAGQQPASAPPSSLAAQQAPAEASRSRAAARADGGAPRATELARSVQPGRRAASDGWE